MPRLALDEAIDRTVAIAPRLAPVPLALDDAAGHVLAEALVFGAPLPPFDHAAMDGYAIRGPADAGRRFVVRGESRAGAPASSVELGAAIAISTGAAVPDGLDTVVPWEDVSREGDEIVLQRAARAGQNVRRAGEDARAGASAIASGTRLSGRHMALLATLERREVLVAPAPRVAILCTGDELRDPGTPPRPGTIVDSNGPMLRALVRQAGGTAESVRVPDRPGALEEALASLRERVDAIVTVGGAADGKHDHVMPALETLGACVAFRGVSIKPGKPVALAQLGALPVLALPGNPGSAFVTFVLLGLPLLRAMQGDARARAERSWAVLERPLRAPVDRDAIVYGALRSAPEAVTERRFAPGPPASSGSIPGLAMASALGLVPAGASLREGDRLAVIRVDEA
ncbi:MAG: molybdopterin molybdotransferase MoeA [Sandaracinaceae bacterium]